MFDSEVKAGAKELELQSNAQETNKFFIKMFPAHNVDEARMRADEMRPTPLMLQLMLWPSKSE